MSIPAALLTAVLAACAGRDRTLALDPRPADAAPQSAPEPKPGAALAFDHAHALLTEILQAHVAGDRFDYAKLKRDPARLERYLGTLQAVTPAELAAWTREERFAFWINAYNAFTLKKVVDNYPLKSIKDLSGALGLKSVFDDEFIPMKPHHPEGKDDRLSLNDIENGILRPVFEDARVHAAINCASFSCPPLLDRAFTAANLEEELNARMRAFLADPKRNRFLPDKGRCEVSEIFKWFREDFERDAGNVRKFLVRYAPSEHRQIIEQGELKYLDYDWALNAVQQE
jgi:hypothetical protein